jgi:hypothetical protein
MTEECAGLNTDVNWLQLLILMVLMFVLAFGIGFILNMLMKTTWFPIYGYIVVVICAVVYLALHSNTGSFMSGLSEFTFVDIVPGIGGLAGAYVSGKTIRTLRVKGFKMF